MIERWQNSGQNVTQPAMAPHWEARSRVFVAEEVQVAERGEQAVGGDRETLLSDSGAESVERKGGNSQVLGGWATAN